ncbi:MAG: coproporphyrinogen-III oxidase family protein [Oscillospiraceae bacterium]
MNFITSLTRIWLTRSFRAFCFTRDGDRCLEYGSAQNLGLYIHIPFCRSLCDFCPYCKVPYREDLARSYVAALKREIELVGGNSPERRKITTLYFGGGSPALVADEIKGIVGTVEKYFEITEGIGLELHPADVTEAKLKILKDAGVTKISIGIQSFEKKYLDLLGRGTQDNGRIFSALRAVPFETVSMDFIFALPGQTIDDLKNDIDTAFGNGANHIAIYPFIDFTYTHRKFEKMPEAQKKRLLAKITEYCRAQGYIRDSIWTFAKPGTKKYSSMTRDNFLGFGCSATTLLTDQFKINTFSIVDYISRINGGTLPTALTLRFTERQRMLYYLFWTAYTTEIDADRFQAFFGKKLERCYGLELLFARILGFVQKNGASYFLTSRGAYYYHYYENFYTLSYIDRMWNLMQAEAFPAGLIIR